MGSTEVEDKDEDKAPAVKIISNRLTRIMAKEGINSAALIDFPYEVAIYRILSKLILTLVFYTI